MRHDVLTPQEMAEADRLTIAAGPLDGTALMRNAAAAVASLVLKHFAHTARVHVLCGPGNNGGDGYVIARILAETGFFVSLWQEGRPKAGSDAATAAADCPIHAQPLASFNPESGSLVIDALYGAALSKPLSRDAANAAEKAAALNLAVISVDLPSGVSGETGLVLGQSFRAAITVTFARKKPAHLLLPGRDLCGQVVVADIGIPDSAIAETGARCVENTPDAWLGAFPFPAIDAHKYRRGHVGVFSGEASATGAARLAAIAAARIGAGAVTVLSPSDAIAANAAHLTSVMLRKCDTLADALAFFEARHPRALVYGPGLRPEAATAEFLAEMLGAEDLPKALVLDASGITSLVHRSQALFPLLQRPGAPEVILTPHEGEFRGFFPDIAKGRDTSKLAKARAAAARSGAVIVYKGADTVVAAPGGQAAINANGTPWLATAGSGDVLSGLCAGLAAQGMPVFEAACAAVWIHAEAAQRFGPGLIAEDLPSAVLPVVRDIFAPSKLTGTEAL
ncbi:NAD(P)H-hydrate dehydratase [Pseudaminobacter sp. NGMCC 1.201702]|uniref:NAD(P)H-hydrate dehydratase n=1 Tax=Pseudaminobacter sp. NGMCC 1.201702 TaxID=3391825 RepID=UPI0039EFA601